MHRWTIVVLLTVLSCGCGSSEQAQQAVVAKNLRELGDELHEKGMPHILIAEAPYHIPNPPQGRPADGTFPKGTKVSLMEIDGSNALVRTDDGIEAFVAIDLLQQVELSGVSPDVEKASKPANE